ncbi:hypothetical protein [Myxococcus hansupus]|uniref:hypothetical protein n=1 Tax=Pseudomyxococcus hansupus TaxID=1297742 RepID=UPI0002F82FB3|nr:hypothetical protein [Myxococcus hansupus]
MDFPDHRWAARLGQVAPGLWQLETLQKYGYYRAPEGTAAVGGQAPDGYLVEYGGGPFSAAWNYLVTTERSGASRFAQAAGLLGEDASLPPATQHAVLCLRTPIRFERPLASWNLSESHLDSAPAARVAEALLTGAPPPRRGRTECVVGLFTFEFGWVHTGALTLFIDNSMEQSWAELEMTGRFNALSGTKEVGPFAHSMYMERPTPVPTPLVAWPFPTK